MTDPTTDPKVQSAARAIIDVGRRRLLTGTGQAVLSASAVGLLIGCESMAGSTQTAAQTAAMSPEADIGILNTALGLEYQAIAAYQVGAESGLLSQGTLAVALQFQGHHKEHAEALSTTVAQLGGVPVEPQASYDFPVGSLKNEADVLNFAAGLEQGAASAYLGAVPALENRDLAKAAASILGDEAMHWAVLRYALGQDPVPSAFIS